MHFIDYHHHTDNSFDSKASMSNVCQQAIIKGIEEICFTEHFSVNPNVPTYGHMNFDQYFSQIKACREAYKGKLIIKAGIELCEPYLLTKEYEHALQGFDLDFILGSVHNINEEKLRKYMIGKTLHDVYQGYFEEVYELVSKADIDVIAHFDLMKRYAMEPLGNYEFADFQEIIEVILEKAVERGIGLEINTSGLSNVKVKEVFPKMDVLKLYRSLGGEILTIGSDSHRAETVGFMLEDALSMANQAGFQYVYTFEKRVAKAIRIDG